MLTELQRRKVNRVFDAFDTDGDGFLEEEDHVLKTREVAAVRGWQPGSAEYENLQNIYMSFWEQLRHADTSRDDRVSRDEYQVFLERMLSDPEVFRATSRPGSDFIFDLFDGDGDGTITMQEYGELLRIYRGSAEDLTDAFAHMDHNGNGTLSKDEFNALFNEFHLSDDPQAPGNHLFGRI